jgi:hypothetical protein
MQAHEIISSHPHVRGRMNDALIRCIEECYSCAQICTSCADACLAEEMVKDLIHCIRLNFRECRSQRISNSVGFLLSSSWFGKI